MSKTEFQSLHVFLVWDITKCTPPRINLTSINLEVKLSISKYFVNKNISLFIAKSKILLREKFSSLEAKKSFAFMIHQTYKKLDSGLPLFLIMKNEKNWRVQRFLDLLRRLSQFFKSNLMSFEKTYKIFRFLNVNNDFLKSSIKNNKKIGTKQF